MEDAYNNIDVVEVSRASKIRLEKALSALRKEFPHHLLVPDPELSEQHKKAFDAYITASSKNRNQAREEFEAIVKRINEKIVEYNDLVEEKAEEILRSDAPELRDKIIQHASDVEGERRALLIRGLPFEDKPSLRAEVSISREACKEHGNMISDLFAAAVRRIIREHTDYTPKPILAAYLGPGREQDQVFHRDSSEESDASDYRYVCFAGHRGGEKTPTDIINVHRIISTLSEDALTQLMSPSFMRPSDVALDHETGNERSKKYTQPFPLITKSESGRYSINTYMLVNLHGEHVALDALECLNDEAKNALTKLDSAMKTNMDRVGIGKGDFMLLDQLALMHRGAAHQKGAGRFVTATLFTSGESRAI